MRSIILAGAALAALTATSPTAAQAQSPAATELIEACYVPASGTMYRIGVEGGKDECTGKSHVYFTFNAQGPAGPAGTAGP